MPTILCAIRAGLSPADMCVRWLKERRDDCHRPLQRWSVCREGDLGRRVCVPYYGGCNVAWATWDARMCVPYNGGLYVAWATWDARVCVPYNGGWNVAWVSGRSGVRPIHDAIGAWIASCARNDVGDESFCWVFRFAVKSVSIQFASLHLCIFASLYLWIFGFCVFASLDGEMMKTLFIFIILCYYGRDRRRGYSLRPMKQRL